MNPSFPRFLASVHKIFLVQQDSDDGYYYGDVTFYLVKIVRGVSYTQCLKCKQSFFKEFQFFAALILKAKTPKDWYYYHFKMVFNFSFSFMLQSWPKFVTQKLYVFTSLLLVFQTMTVGVIQNLHNFWNLKLTKNQNFGLSDWVKIVLLTISWGLIETKNLQIS